jgi:hypothetical protein
VAQNQENTGKLYVDGDATAGLFTNASDFSQLAGSDRNLIWSDRSATPHTSPSISNGAVQNDSGSADWTNGHLLDFSQVETQFLNR